MRLTILGALLSALFFVGQARADQRIYGNCETGGQTVLTAGQGSSNTVQGSFPACTVSVFTTGTINLATIYGDNARTPLGNPFTANSSSGAWFFYLPQGQRVDIQLSGGGLASPVTLGDVVANDSSLTTTSNVTYASSFLGTSDQQISSAIASLGSPGGVVYANYSTNQTWAACPTWGSAPITLVLYSVLYTYSQASATCTIPSNISLQFYSGALLSVSSASSAIVHQGSVSAGNRQQIVSASGSGYVRFANIPYAYVDWWGAKGDGSTDDQPAIQRAIDAECATGINGSLSGGGPKPQIALVAGGKYSIGKPLHLYCRNSIFGGVSGQTNAWIVPSFRFGDDLVVASNVSLTAGGPGGYCGIPPCVGTLGVPLTAGLTSSGGNALVFDGGANIDTYWFNCDGDSVQCNINGATALTIEAFAKFTSVAGQGVIMQSSGNRGHSEAVTSGYRLLQNTNTLNCLLKTTGSGTVTVNGGTLLTNTLYHLAMTWDGATMRCFLNGVSVGSIAATGTLVQAITENVQIGPSIADWPEGDLLFASIVGTMDSIRLSNVARYTSNFTPPTAKLGNDSNTLMLMNWGGCFDIFCDVQSKDGTGYFTMRDSSLIVRNEVDAVQVRNINFQNPTNQNAIFSTTSTDAVYDNIQVNGSCAYCFYFLANTFNTHFNDIFITAGAGTKTGITGSGAAGLWEFTNVKVIGAQIPLVLFNGSGVFHNVALVPESETVIGALLKGVNSTESYTFDGVGIDDEVPGPLLTDLFISSNRSVNIRGSQIESIGVSTPDVYIDGGGMITFDTVSMVMTGTPMGGAIHFISAPTFPVTIMNSAQFGVSGVPWCDLATQCTTINGSNRQVSYTAGTISAVNDTVCFSANNTVADCATSAINPVGVAKQTNATYSVIDVVVSGVTTVKFDGTYSPSAGWVACTSASVVGTVQVQSAATPCPDGRQVGTLTTGGTNITSGTIMLGFK